MSFYIAQFFAAVSMIFGVVSFQVKDMKKILICQLGANGFLILNYALLGGISGAGIAFVAVIQSVVIFLYDRKDKKMPVPAVVGFMLLYVLISAMTFEGLIDFLPCIAALCFAVSLLQKGPAGYRRCMLLNILLWIVYDLSVQAYMSIAGRIILLISIISAMIRYDLKLKKDK